MVLVDTSVWVDFLRGDETPQVRALNPMLSGQEIVGTTPMILQEILQGAESAERFETWIKYFSDLFCYVPRDAVKPYIAPAQHYQYCRRAGNTPRSSIDAIGRVAA